MPASCRAFAWHAFFHARVFFFLPFLSAAHVFNVVIQAAIAPGFHLFPSRTEKLSPAAPMVLRHSGRVGRRLFFERQSPALPVVVGRGIAFSDAPPAARSSRPPRPAYGGRRTLHPSMLLSFSPSLSFLLFCLVVNTCMMGNNVFFDIDI